MSTKFITFENCKQGIAQESLVEKVANYYNVDNSFKQLEKGLESYEAISKLYEVVKKQNTLSKSLEKSINLTLKSCKDIVGDYSPTISLESYSSLKCKRSIALEGIGSFLKSIWKAIVNFFKKIIEWITGKSSTGSTSQSIEQKKEKTKDTDKKQTEVVRTFEIRLKAADPEEQAKIVEKFNTQKAKDTYRRNQLKIGDFKTYDEFFINGLNLIALLNTKNKEKIDNLGLLFLLLKENQKHDDGPLTILAKDKLELGYNLDSLHGVKKEDGGNGSLHIGGQLLGDSYSLEYLDYTYMIMEKYHEKINNSPSDSFLNRYSILSSLRSYYSSKNYIDQKDPLNEYALFSKQSENQKALEGILDKFSKLSKDNEKIEETYTTEIEKIFKESRIIMERDIELPNEEDKRSKTVLLKFLTAETRALASSIFQVNALLRNYTDIFMDLKNNARFLEQLALAKKLNINLGY